MTVAGYTTEEPLPSPGLADDRALRSFRDLVRACLPQLALLGLWEYRVESTGTSSVVCSPVNADIGLPGAVTAQIVPSVLGERVTPAVGSIVVLAFLNGDPGRPVVVGGDPSAPPTLATIGGLAGAAGVARQGDSTGLTCAATFKPTGEMLTLTIGGATLSSISTGPKTATGTITTGSATIRAGA